MAEAGKPPEGGGAADPSMEDILASIRRILNEDEAAPAPATSMPITSPKPPAEAAEPEALNLTEEMLVAEPVAAAPAPPAPEPEPEPEPEPPAPPVYAAPAPPPPAPPPQPTPVAAHEPAYGEALLSDPAAAAAAASMSNLMRAVGTDRGAYVYRGGPTIEDAVRDELRPMLKAWLDTNLPPLVERLVRAEIERVVDRALN